MRNVTDVAFHAAEEVVKSNEDKLIIFICVFAIMIAFVYMVVKLIEAIRDSRESRDSGTGSRHHFIKPRKLYSSTFNENKFKNFCGVEIECINKHKNFSASDARTVNFKKVGDGSLSYHGEEFVSKPANGDRLFNMVDKMCKKLNERKYSIDKTCGLHIHIETPDELELLKKLYIFYAKYEDFFFKMLPKSRQKSSFCRKIKNVDGFSIKAVKNIMSLGKFKRKYYETNFYSGDMSRKYYEKRRCWTNFHSIFYRGTLEIRAHSGTINSDKIKNWIAIHLTIRDFVENKSLEEIYSLPLTKEEFMKIFPKNIRKYLESRWGKFKDKEEEYECAKYK